MVQGAQILPSKRARTTQMRKSSRAGSSKGTDESTVDLGKKTTVINKYALRPALLFASFSNTPWRMGVCLTGRTRSLTGRRFGSSDDEAGFTAEAKLQVCE
ncbi:hypothetical protein FOZ63_028451 [Perkinsus olseni]|uniref:Uncharacterized protein n=1 Tax=Perkinsus olseni TaxID=32597 RepID=A0A7J6TTY8_PEROL|nr:hypothetical protein FOZ62_029266 [Perkinsus olseni]KAF4748217.1 hypothetical protein FOZ63_028451 [Perkinsus olseni]